MISSISRMTVTQRSDIDAALINLVSSMPANKSDDRYHASNITSQTIADMPDNDTMQHDETIDKTTVIRTSRQCLPISLKSPAHTGIACQCFGIAILASLIRSTYAVYVSVILYVAILIDFANRVFKDARANKTESADAIGEFLIVTTIVTTVSISIISLQW